MLTQEQFLRMMKSIDDDRAKKIAAVNKLADRKLAELAKKLPPFKGVKQLNRKQLIAYRRQFRALGIKLGPMKSK